MENFRLVFLNRLSTRDLRNWWKETYGVVWADSQARQLVAPLGSSANTVDDDVILISVDTHIEGCVGVEIYGKSCLARDLLGTVRIPVQDFAEGISNRMYDIIHSSGTLEGKLIVNGGLMDERVAVDTEGRTASWMESLEDVDTNSPSSCVIAPEEIRLKHEDEHHSDKEEITAYSTTSYTRTESCGSVMDWADDDVDDARGACRQSHGELSSTVISLESHNRSPSSQKNDKQKLQASETKLAIKAKGTSARFCVNDAEMAESYSSSSSIVSASTVQQEQGQIKLEVRRSDINRHSNRRSSFAEQKQELTLPSRRSKSFQASPGSLVASRVKHFEEMIHCEKEDVQPSKLLQKQRSEITNVQSGGAAASFGEGRE